jgi:hypothetical protein
MGAAELAVPDDDDARHLFRRHRLGVFGIAIGYGFARALRLHPRNARTVALETGIQNGPLAIAIIAFTFAGDEAQATWPSRRSIRCSS